ncbi:MAG: hypothetical protein IKH75_10280 [Ruminococcus sp.]|nr:hypothetical protein [Ruminococcus sp.]
MKRGELTGATLATLIIYLAAPDILNKFETVLFLIVVFGCAVCVIWSIEELQKRIRRARRIAKRKRRVFDINLRSTGLIEDGGKEVSIIG